MSGTPGAIYVWPHFIRGGVDTILSLAKLFDIPIDSGDFSSPITLFTFDLKEEDKRVLLQLLAEFQIVK